jgi:hypothetical protein
MTVPGDPTREQPAVQPTVSTEPAPGTPHRWWSAIPRHLGRARTSTIVLVLLFLATGVLYLYVKPEETAASTPTGGDPAVNQPATTTGGTTAPAPTTAPPPTTSVPVEPSTQETTTTSAPEETTVPEETTETVPPSTTETVPPVPSAPTSGTPTG